MGLNEKRLILLGLSKINPRTSIADVDLFDFTVTTEEWAAVFPNENPYKALKLAATGLFQSFITLHPKVGVKKKINWFDTVVYNENKASVEMRFSRSVQVRLSGMVDQFTKINLLSVNRLKSIHSIRLYELLTQFKSGKFKTAGWREISISDLKFALGLAEKYKQVKELKRNVINPSILAINKNSDLLVTFKDVKEGRKIVGFRFVFSDKKQGDSHLQMDLVGEPKKSKKNKLNNQGK